MSIKRLTTPILIALLVSTSAMGQNKTYFGIEFSVVNDLYKITDNGGYLRSIPLVDAQGGIFIRQELGRRVFLETGAIMKYYWEGFGFKTIPYYGSSSSDPSWIFPLRLGLHLNLYHSKIFLAPVVGYAFGINPRFGSVGAAYGHAASSTTSIAFSFTESPDVTRYFSLMQTGIGVEFKLFHTLLLSVSSNYYRGFNETIRLDIDYTVNNTSQAKGTAITKGDFWGVTTGIKYPISNFWRKTP